MGHLRVGLDMDGVLFDFTGGWAAAYQRQFGGDLIRPEDCTQWDVSNLTHFPDGRQWFAWIERDHPQLFRYLRPLPGALRMVRQVADVADVVVITTKPRWARACTFVSLAEHEVPASEVHLTRDKTRVECDIYLDDGPHNLEALHDAHPAAMVCRWVQPWNRPIEGVHDFDDYDEFVAQVDALA